MSKHEKGKPSAGLLDSWFGRPGRPNKGKGKGSAPSNGGSGRPISLEADAMADLQEITNEIHKLSVEEVNQKFMEILEDMNIPKDKRQPLLLKSLDEKREMLIMKGMFIQCLSLCFPGNQCLCLHCVYRIMHLLVIYVYNMYSFVCSTSSQGFKFFLYTHVNSHNKRVKINKNQIIGLVIFFILYLCDFLTVPINSF